MAWHLCLLRPDRVRAVVALAVPYYPRAPFPVTEFFAARGDGFYITGADLYRATLMHMHQGQRDFLLVIVSLMRKVHQVREKKCIRVI